MTLFDLAPKAGTLTGQAVADVSALEVDFPADVLSAVAEQESWRKEVHRPATATHKWWAKRLGSVFRGILTSAVSTDRASSLAAYEASTALQGLTVFDPFAGSGTTIVETLKLGGRAIGWDINPVATLVQRQAVQRWDLAELQRGYDQIEANCRAEIDRVHRTSSGETVLYYFWVAVADCLDCGATTRLFSRHVFSQNAYPGKVPKARIVCPKCLDVFEGRYDFVTATCANGHCFTNVGAVSASTVTCENGHSKKVIESLRSQPPRREMFAKIVLGADGKKRYEGIDDFDRSLYAETSSLLDVGAARLVRPYGRLETGENTKQAIRWNYRTWDQFFNDRQLYSLGLLGASIRDLDVRGPEREALAALFSGVLEFNNVFCSFKGEGTGAVRHMFSNHVLKPERTPLEAHPWGTPSSSGSFSTLFKSRIQRAHGYKVGPTDQVLVNGKVAKTGNISQPLEAKLKSSWGEGLGDGEVYLTTGNSAKTDLPDGSVDLVVTDPPYMDNVHYSELADFFHAWLTQLRPFSEYPHTSESTRAQGEVQSASPEEFQIAIQNVWTECARVLKQSGLLAFTFHQARLSGWVALVEALANAGLTVTAVQPIKGEMSTSVTKGGKEPSNLDSIIVCRKRALGAGRVDAARAADLALETLVYLASRGLKVGAGDVRSVVRGSVLAEYTSDPAGTDLDKLAAQADELATARIAAFAEQSATGRAL
ncbi:DNA methylase [Rhodococcus sp. NKCM2511]|uniref:DNA methyltransferase n=1 Tax=Rhodococcus sp. NKCM2511 TaxID=2766011 RepID=UPI00190FDAEE|nr:DNA methyltransferase [Rhodococcus sp. NKCM2511]GHP20055.1 DNA methylase [Rhodococcus sp. NKCM2511]